MFTQTDLNLTHRIRFGNDNRFAVAFDFNVLNVFNESNILAVNQNKHSGYFGMTEITGDYVTDINKLTSTGVLADYAAAEAQFAVDNGVPIAWTRNVAFNQPIAFQDPRSVRFGFRFQF
ncbi:MAG TPA: hypothetical protein VGW76_15950, partial [Pyrinomonadaceae bacterium]|nr:hypothetical protein [Pyrinomonadaceae bacterium]